MSWRIHHVNVPAPNYSATIEFYESVFGMQDAGMPLKERDRGCFKHDRENVSWYEDGSAQIHISRPNPNMGRDNGFFLNPSLKGHLAIEVDDIERVKANLEARDLYFADPGHWAVQDLYQLYVIDPSTNMVEINQKL